MNFSPPLYCPNASNRLRGAVSTGRCSDHRNFKNCLNSHPLAFLRPDALLTTGVTQAVILHTSITAHPFRHERGRHLSFRYCSQFLLLTSWLLSFLQKHEDICQYCEEQCQACGESVERRHLEQHRTKDCINRAVACTYCGMEVLQSNMEVRNTWASPLL